MVLESTGWTLPQTNKSFPSPDSSTMVGEPLPVHLMSANEINISWGRIAHRKESNSDRIQNAACHHGYRAEDDERQSKAPDHALTFARDLPRPVVGERKKAANAQPDNQNADGQYDRWHESVIEPHLSSLRLSLPLSTTISDFANDLEMIGVWSHEGKSVSFDPMSAYLHGRLAAIQGASVGHSVVHNDIMALSRKPGASQEQRKRQVLIRKPALGSGSITQYSI